MRSLSKLLSIFVAACFVSTGAQAATVSLSGAPGSVGVNDVFVLDLVGTGFNDGDLDGGGINLSFESDIINVLNVSVNTVDWEFFSTSGDVSNPSGMVSGITFNSFQSHTGNLVFASIQFIAVGTGATNIGLSEAGTNPFSTGGVLYNNLVLDQSASVLVSNVPVPGALWLFISGLGLLAVRRKRVF